MRLFGRGTECEVVDHLLGQAISGHGGAIVIHGEPGIGKSALLNYAMESAAEFQVLYAVGNEAEMELPYAIAQQFCAPKVAAAEDLPEPQRNALRVAFGQLVGSEPDRLFMGLAVLGLLTQLASKGPVLCVVDDAHWLDQESAQAFAIVARRLNLEHIAFLFGARTVPIALSGLPELPVRGLVPTDARDLLSSVLPGAFDEVVFERIIEESVGNPLALLELPYGLIPAAGGFSVPISGSVAGRVEGSFQRRIERLPPPSRLLLLVAAAEPTGDPVLVWRAAERLGVDESAATVVASDGLLEMTPRVTFRHPLVRSAVYRGASPADRRQAHGAIAEVTDKGVDPDRRAWHLAQAAWRPDDEVATNLEESAGRAQARGGFAAAAAFLARAAELTVDPKRRVERTLAAADAKRQAGAFESALELASNAERCVLDDSQRAQLDALRAQISFASQRGSEAPSLLLKAAFRLEGFNARWARDTYLDALSAALFAGPLSQGASALDVARAAMSAPQPLGPPVPTDLLLDGLALMTSTGPAAATPVLKDALSGFLGDSASTEERMRWAWLAGQTAGFIWDYDTWDLLSARNLEMARDAGALSSLPLIMSSRAGVHLFAGELALAISMVEQVESVADVIDSHIATHAALAAAALRGRETEAVPLIESALKDFIHRGEGMGVTLAQWATAVLHNGLARYDSAFKAAESALRDPSELWFSPWARVEFIEAASRTGQQAAAGGALDRLIEGTAASGTEWAAAVEDRCRALLSEGAAAEKFYRSAIDRLGPTVLRLDLARSHLLFGEWLRRENRPVDAREHLRDAYELFTDIGSESYAERARVELRATGERTRKGAGHPGGQLTPQETRVAHLVAQGSTNVEIAAQMFISPSTVEYHLHKVFRKLEVRTRTQLARRILESASAGDAQ